MYRVIGFAGLCSKMTTAPFGRNKACIAFGLAGFVGCFPRPDITHIAFAAPLALPLLACCMTRLT